MPSVRKWWPYLTLALAPLLVLWRAVFFGQAIGPFDQIRQMEPWKGPKPGQSWDVLQADGVLQFYPWRQLVFESWGRFQVPFWNHYELAGTPLLANSQSAAFYPLHILMGVLHVPTAVAITLLAWFHLAWAGIGTSILARQLGANKLGGTVAGLSFTLSAFMVSWAGLPSVITTVAWIPWVLLLTLRFLADDGLRTGVALAFCAAMLILAGHLQFVAYGFMAAAFLAIYQTAVTRKVTQLGGWFAVLLLVGAMSSPQILPVLNYSKYSHRRNSPTEEGYAGYAASAIQPFELIGLVHPNLVGSPTEAVKGIETPQPLSSYWPEYVKRGANFAEGAIGVGPLVLGLVAGLFAFRRFDLRRLGGIAVVGLVGLLLATGTILGKLLYFGVPGWSSTGSPGRASVLFVLAACVLAGVGLSSPQMSDKAKPWFRFLPAGIVGLLGLLSIYAAMFALSGLQPLPPLNADIFATILSSATGQAKALAGLSTLIAAAGLALYFRSPSPLAVGRGGLVPQGEGPSAESSDDQNRPSSPALLPREKGVVLVAAIVCFFLSVPQVLHFSASSDLRSEAYQPMDLKPFERVANINAPWEIWIAAPANHPPNTSSLSGLHELGGYDSLVHKDTVAMLKEIDGQDPPPAANGNMMFVKPTATEPKLAEAGVTAMSYLEEGRLYVGRIKGPGRAYTPAGPAEITYEDAGQIRLRATGPGKLTLKDRNMPGWTALVDGKVEPIGGTIWRELQLPEGEHGVVMNYVAPGYSPWIAIGAWLVAVFALAASFRRER